MSAAEASLQRPSPGGLAEPRPRLRPRRRRLRRKGSAAAPAKGRGERGGGDTARPGAPRGGRAGGRPVLPSALRYLRWKSVRKGARRAGHSQEERFPLVSVKAPRVLHIHSQLTVATAETAGLQQSACPRFSPC
ncbi:uncharacterized protein LOC135294971 isoform X2 [Passer domesticus]|uniref:uncharacterized protein LOC135294971 isoform X2 n=1 Tax=Passer domesticus TaxID=48849 RepID=UPI0030FE629D